MAGLMFEAVAAGRSNAYNSYLSQLTRRERCGSKSRNRRPEFDTGERTKQIRSEAKGPAAKLPDAGYVSVEFTSQGLPAHRSDWQGEVPVLFCGLLYDGCRRIAAGDHCGRPNPAGGLLCPVFCS